MLTRPTLQWLVILLLAAVAVAGFGGYYVWRNTDLLLRRGIESTLATLVPEWDIAFRHVHFDGEGGIRLVDVSVAAPGEGPIVEIPELHVALDRDLFAQYRKVSIQKVVILNPVATLVRFPDGKWNFQRLAPLPPSEAALPEIQVVNGDLLIRQQATDLLPVAEIGCHHVAAHLVPSANRQYEIDGTTDVDHTGPLKILGAIDLRSGAWEIAGMAPKVDVRDGLVDMAMDASPAVRQRLETLVRPARQLKGDSPIRTASAANDEIPVSLLPELGIEAQLDVAFRVGMEERGSPLEYLVKVGIEQGKILDLLPVPLFDLQGVVQIDEKGVQIKKLSAANGMSRVFVDGDVKFDRDGGGKQFTVQATNLHIDQKIREHLPGHLQKLYDSLRPEGRFNVDIEVRHQPGAAPSVTLRQFTVLDGSVEHEAFRYPVKGVSGKIRQEENKFVLDLIGFAGDRPCNLTGTASNLGPDMELDIRIHAGSIPIDEHFVNAFQLEKQQPVRKAIESLQAHGVGDCDVRFVRSPATDRKFKMQLDAKVRDVTMSYVRFPYGLTRVSGELHYDALKEDVWNFTNFTGDHRGTSIKGSGSYTVAKPGLLRLDFDATSLPIDQELRDAVDVAAPHLDPLFDHLQPAGLADVQGARILWSPGEPVRIDFPFVAVNNGRLKLSGFPYQWERVSATGSWDHAKNKLTIATLLGWHGETYLQVDGQGAPSGSDAEGNANGGGARPGDAYILVKPRENITWRAHFDRMFVGRMVADIDFLRALPANLQTVVQGAEIRGAVDIQASLDLKQFSDEVGTVTGQWRSETMLSGNDVYAGVPLTGVRGKLVCVNGSWNGERAMIDGYFDVQRARTYGLPLENIVGPYHYDGELVTVGKPGTFHVDRPDNRYAQQSVEGQIYGGQFGVDAQVRVGETDDKTVYGAVLTVRNAAVERWAFDNGKREKLRGPVNGVVNLSGRGKSPLGLKGNGWLQLTNAQLYDLPVLLQVFTKMDLTNPDTTAFHYAYSDFQIHDGIIDFSGIELVGKTLSLIGRGFVGFAGERERVVQLDFNTRVKNQIPIIGPLVTAGGKGWMTVRVMGTVDTNQAFVQARNPLLDDAFGGFMRSIDAGNWRPRAAPQQQVNPFPLAP